MKIAMRDLEIRGAGDILGAQQSGQIAAIGFHLYCKLLKRAIDALKKKAPIAFIETKMEFSFDARLPETYIGEISLRMEIYHRFGEARPLRRSRRALRRDQRPLRPAAAPRYFLYHLTRIRLFASQHQFTLLKFNDAHLPRRKAAV